MSNILIVDDKVENLQLLSELLQDEGYTVRPAPSGAIALKAVEMELPDLILLDLMMPDLDGYEVCQRLKANSHTADIPVIFISAASDVMNKVQGFRVGAVDYLTKPFDSAEVLIRVKTHLSIQNMEKKLKEQNSLLENAKEHLEHEVELRTKDLRVALDQKEQEVIVRKKAEEKLRINESFLTRAQEVAQIGSWHLNFGDNHLSLSQETYKLLEISLQSNFTFDLFKELIHPEDREMFNTKWEGALQNELFNIEHRLIVNGKTIWVNDIADFTFNEDGTPQSAIGTIQNITERKKQESERKLLATTVEFSPISIIVTDTDGIIQYVNPACETVSGYDKEELIGNKTSIFNSGKHSIEYYQSLCNTIKKGEVWRGNMINKKKDGSLYEEMVQIAPITNEFGDILNFVSVRKDITEERSLEKQLHQAQKMEALGQLAGGVAHDFNNMLQVIIGHTGLAQSSVPEDDPILDDLDGVQQASEAAIKLVRQLLIFSRQEEIEPKELNLNSSLHDMLKMIQRLIRSDITFTFSPSDSDLYMYADPGHIQQVVMNLCVNARDAMLKAGELAIKTDSVTVTDEFCYSHPDATPGKYVLLQVSDTGSGIPKVFLEHIFEPFFTTKEAGKGTGLGLATIYAIVQKQGGFITIDTETDKGTTFSVYFPQYYPELKEAFDISDGETWANFRGKGELILVVENDHRVLNYLSRLLIHSNFRILAAQNGESALSEFENNYDEIKLVISSLVLSKKSGREIYEFVKSRNSDIPVIFTSGYTVSTLSPAYYPPENELILHKPIHVYQLFKEISKKLYD